MMLREDPTLTKKQVDTFLRSLREDCEFADEVRLAKMGALFDHRGDAPIDADAIVMDALAADYRNDLAFNKLSEVAQVARERGAALGLKVLPGSIDVSRLGFSRTSISTMT